MWSLSKNVDKSAQQIGRNNSLLLNSMHPLLQHRNLNGNGVSWLQFKSWRSLPSPREYFDTLAILCPTVI